MPRWTRWTRWTPRQQGETMRRTCATFEPWTEAKHGKTHGQMHAKWPNGQMLILAGATSTTTKTASVFFPHEKGITVMSFNVVDLMIQNWPLRTWKIWENGETPTENIWHHRIWVGTVEGFLPDSRLQRSHGRHQAATPCHQMPRIRKIGRCFGWTCWRYLKVMRWSLKTCSSFGYVWWDQWYPSSTVKHNEAQWSWGTQGPRPLFDIPRVTAWNGMDFLGSFTSKPTAGSLFVWGMVSDIFCTWLIPELQTVELMMKTGNAKPKWLQQMWHIKRHGADVLQYMDWKWCFCPSETQAILQTGTKDIKGQTLMPDSGTLAAAETSWDMLRL